MNTLTLHPPAAARALLAPTSIERDAEPLMPTRAIDAGQAELTALTRAMQTVNPACLGDERFTRDKISADEQLLGRICAECPLSEACAAYGAAARPDAGIWAGNRYNVRSGQS